MGVGRVNYVSGKCNYICVLLGTLHQLVRRNKEGTWEGDSFCLEGQRPGTCLPLAAHRRSL